VVEMYGVEPLIKGCFFENPYKSVVVPALGGVRRCGWDSHRPAQL